jgi:hypothetical protein
MDFVRYSLLTTGMVELQLKSLYSYRMVNSNGHELSFDRKRKRGKSHDKR